MTGQAGAEWRNEVLPPDAFTIEEIDLARRIVELMKAQRPRAFFQGSAESGSTSIDGEFDLRLIARRILQPGAS